jgi:DNA ligase-1
MLCRSLKPPKSKLTQVMMRDLFRAAKSTGFTGPDGEAMAGDIYASNVMQNSSSMFNSFDKMEPFTYMLFDSYQHADWPFQKRLDYVQMAVERLQPEFPWLQFTEHRMIHNMEELMAFLAEVEQMGGEGVMGRDPNGIYKMGRSSMKDGILWALKPYADGECVIESIHEMMQNTNEATINELGHTARSGHKAGMVGKGTFGYAVCRSPDWPETFRIGMGPGLNDALRAYIWAHPEEFVGATLKYKYQAIGCVDRPRQPKWMGIRGPEDLGEG